MIQTFVENKQLDSKVCGEEEGAWARGVIGDKFWESLEGMYLDSK